jgi:hypothetical protein
MANEEQKKARLLMLSNSLISGYGKGLYDLFGDSALATVSTIGESTIKEMENEMGLEIHGENPQDILSELGRILVDEYGLARSMKFEIQGQDMNVVCQGCLLWPATKSILASGAPPFHCVPMMLAKVVIGKRLGKKTQFVSLKQEDSTKVCDIHARILD